MKAKLSLVLTALTLSLAAQPAPSPGNPLAAPDKCASFCAVVFCVPNQTCGPFINSSGQTVCGCHEDPFGV
ncbi:MAG: hypothetical protein ACJ76N_31155 [Thermoanaerobaculia bacterium]